jgi:hypothetical protein
MRRAASGMRKSGGDPYSVGHVLAPVDLVARQIGIVGAGFLSHAGQAGVNFSSYKHCTEHTHVFSRHNGNAASCLLWQGTAGHRRTAVQRETPPLAGAGTAELKSVHFSFEFFVFCSRLQFDCAHHARTTSLGGVGLATISHSIVH